MVSHLQRSFPDDVTATERCAGELFAQRGVDECNDGPGREERREERGERREEKREIQPN